MTITNGVATTHTVDYAGSTFDYNQIDTLITTVIRDGEFTDEFKKEFTAKAIGHFGSGWAWLVQDNAQKLKIVTTTNAQTPLADNLKPLLVCDVWEHAYYIDVRNARPAYLENFWKLVNWDYVAENLDY